MYIYICKYMYYIQIYIYICKYTILYIYVCINKYNVTSHSNITRFHHQPIYVNTATRSPFTSWNLIPASPLCWTCHSRTSAQSH